MRFESLQNYPSGTMKPKASFRLTGTNRAVIIDYSQLIGCRRPNFSIGFWKAYLVQQFNDLRNGTRSLVRSFGAYRCIAALRKLRTHRA